MLAVVVRKVLRVPVERASEVARLRVRTVQLRVVDELMVAADVLSLSELVKELLFVLPERAVVGPFLQTLRSRPRHHARSHVTQIVLIHRLTVQAAHVRVLPVGLLIARLVWL